MSKYFREPLPLFIIKKKKKKKTTVNEKSLATDFMLVLKDEFLGSYESTRLRC